MFNLKQLVVLVSLVSGCAVAAPEYDEPTSGDNTQIVTPTNTVVVNVPSDPVVVNAHQATQEQCLSSMTSTDSYPLVACVKQYNAYNDAFNAYVVDASNATQDVVNDVNGKMYCWKACVVNSCDTFLNNSTLEQVNANVSLLKKKASDLGYTCL